MTDDPDRLVTVTSAATEFAANVAVAVLADHGIEAKAFTGIASWWGSSGPGGRVGAFWNIPVQVRARDLDRARTALTENRRDSVDIDWDAVELGEREDTMPMTAVGHTPVAARVAIWVVAIIVLAAFALGLTLLLQG